MAGPIGAEGWAAHATSRRWRDDRTARRTREALATLLSEASAFAGAGDFAEAYRRASAALRSAPQDAHCLLLACRLALRLGRPAEALEICARARACEPRLELARAEALAACGDQEAAAQALNAVLAAAAADAVRGFEEIAEAAVIAGAPGWVGWLSEGRITGLLSAESAAALSLPGLRTEPRAGNRMRLTAPADVESRRALLALLAPGVIGRELLLQAPSWRFFGEFAARGSVLAGSATMDWAPQQPLTVEARHPEGDVRRTQTWPACALDGREIQGFALRASGGDGLEVRAQLPDGSWTAVWDSGAARAEPPQPRRRRAASAQRPVAIVIPVWGGREETLTCLRSAAATTDRAETEIVVVNDASPDAALTAELRALAAAGRIALLENAVNLGFGACANRGMAAWPGHDVVLLNADAQVFGDWLQRLRKAAYAAPDIGTATPLASAGSIMTYPGGEEGDIGAEEAAAIDALSARLNAGVGADLPSGVGYCLYIRRDCLEETGELDAAAFGRGYGEDNDFCRRARALGWRHVGAADVFVRHAGGRSFGPLKPLLIAHALRLLEQRHPGYAGAVRAFAAADPLAAARRRLDEARLKAGDRASVLLIGLGGLGGGVGRRVKERARALAKEGLRVLTLAGESDDRRTWATVAAAGERFGDLQFTLPDAFDALTAFLQTLSIERVEVHHFIGLGRQLEALLQRLGRPYEVAIHDYAWLCPRITLISGEARYCGEPPLAACEACVAAHGGLIEEEIGVGELRARSARVFGRARRVVAPSADAASRVARRFAGITPVLGAWESMPDAAAPPAPACGPGPAPGRRFRIGLIGAIGEHKGYKVLRDCAVDAAARDLPLEFTVIGFSEDDASLLETGRVFVTGAYAEDEAAALMAREGPDALFFPSVWPETWCYALTHALASGLPILAFEVGALGERLAGVARARLIAPGTEAGALNDVLLELARRRLAAGAETAAAEEPNSQARGERTLSLGEGATVTLVGLDQTAAPEDAG
ncbi:MAG TPA: glycosyltransferase [Caulobacteraceae bacterium]|nr:glycosyltransferase [Caulobacteraceae bacterium]